MTKNRKRLSFITVHRSKLRFLHQNHTTPQNEELTRQPPETSSSLFSQFYRLHHTVNVWQLQGNTRREQGKATRLSTQCQSLFLHPFDYIQRHAALQAGQRNPAAQYWFMETAELLHKVANCATWWDWWREEMRFAFFWLVTPGEVVAGPRVKSWARSGETVCGVCDHGAQH